MSKVAIEGNASGTGTLTIAAPNTNSNFTLDIPSASGVIDRLNRAGNVLQVVHAADNTEVTTTGQEILTVSITPASASNKILVFAAVSASVTANSNAYLSISIRRNGSAITTAADSNYGLNSATNYFAGFPVYVLDSPATTSATTYGLRLGRGSSGTISVTSSGYYTITAMEIAG